jgi:CubicO group peptidase (beta-lactamase class C family)
MVARGPGNPPITPEISNTLEWRRAEIPSGSGFGNARSIGAVQSVLGNGGQVRGFRLLSATGCERALEEQFAGVDTLLGTRVRYGMGYGLQGRTCMWGGMGGSLVMVDFDSHLTVAYAMNQMLDQGTLSDDRGLSMIFAAYEGLR